MNELEGFIIKNTESGLQGAFRILSNIYDEAFFAKTINRFQLLTISPQKLHSRCSADF